MNNSQPFRVGILTVSDKGHAGERADTAGPELGRLLDPRCYQVAAAAMVPDEPAAIAAQLTAWSDIDGLDLILTTGGRAEPPGYYPGSHPGRGPAPGAGDPRGHAGREPWPFTPHAMLSRGVAVIRGHTLIINLPGSPKGARENLAAVAPALPHALEKLRAARRSAGRSRVEIVS